MDYKANYEKLKGRYEKLQKRFTLLTNTVSAKTYNLGDEYFRAIVKYLNGSLEADYTYVGRLLEGDTVQTISFYGKRGYIKDLSYKLANTPCENVLNQAVCSYPDNVARLFPKDTLLRELSVDGYVGVPLYDTEKNPNGILVSLFCHPVSDTEVVEAMMLMFASRIGAELEHQNIQQDFEQARSRLKKQNQELLLQNQQLEITKNKLHRVNEKLLRVNKSLSLSESRLKEAQKVASLGYYNFDAKTGLWTNSDELDEIFGIDKNFNRDVEGWMQIIHPDFREEMLTYLQVNVLTHHEQFNREYKIMNLKTREERWVRGLGNLRLDGSNRAVEMFGIIQDITIHKELESALLESEERFSLAVKGSNDAIWDWEDLESDTYWWSDRLYEMLGYKPGEVESRISNWTQWMHPDDTARVLEILDKHLKEGLPYQAEFRMKKKDGQYIWLSARGETVRDSTGKPIRMTGSVSDISVRKKAEQDLKRSEKKYRLLFENMTSGFALHKMVYDKNKKPVDYTYLEVNPAFEYHTGLKAADILGKNVREILPEIEDYWIQNYGQVALSGKPMQFENYVKELDKYYSVYCFSPIKDHFAVVFHDTTEQKLAQEKVIKNEKQLQLVFDNSPAIMMLLDDQARILKVNKTGKEFCGLDYEDILLKQGGDVLGCIFALKNSRGCGKNSQCDHCIIRKTITDTIHTHQSHNRVEAEMQVLRGDQYVPVNVLVSSVLAGDKKDPVYLITIDDVTLLKKAEKSEKENATKYKTLADNTYDWEYWKGPDEKYIYISPSCQRITGHSPEAFMDQPGLFHSLIMKEDMGNWKKHEEKSAQQLPCKTPLEFRIVAKSGKVRWINHVCKPVYDDQGKYLGNRGTNRDITVQKLSQLALTESEMRFRQLAELAFEGILIHKSGIILDVNKATEKLLGYKREELIGNDGIELCVPPEYYKVLERMAQADTSHIHELELIRKNGKRIPVEMISSLISKADKIRVVAIRNISTQKETQRKILNAIISTEEQERRRIAQELHDGLGPVLSTIKLYTQTYIKSDKPAFREKIEGQLLIGIDEALEQVSAISNNLSPHVLNDFGLSAAIQKFIDKVQKISSLKILYQGSIDSPLEKDVEITLYRVSIELINNSLKHAQAKTISLSIEKSDSAIVLEYFDDGIGFNFDEMKMGSKGMGLFNIVNRIKSLGGTVSFKRLKNNGIHYLIKVQDRFSS